MAQDTLEELAHRADRGDSTALNALLHGVAPSMHGVIRTVVVGTGIDTDDLLQDSLVELLRALHGFRGESTFRHYSCRVALFVALRARKKHARRTAKMRWLRHDPDGVARSSLPQGVAGEDAERRAALGAVLDGLPKDQSETLWLKWVLGHSVDEIASLMEVERNTVRSRLRRGKDAIRQRIESNPRLRGLLGVDS